MGCFDEKRRKRHVRTLCSFVTPHTIMVRPPLSLLHENNISSRALCVYIYWEPTEVLRQDTLLSGRVTCPLWRGEVGLGKA